MSDQQSEDQDHTNAADRRSISQCLLEPLIGDLKSSALTIIETSSPEAVHVMRVTLRKIRAWIGLCKNQLSEDQINDTKTYIRWLSDITGPARDADVQLAKNLQAQTKLPKAAKAKLKHQQAESYKQIVSELGSPRFSAFATLLVNLSADIALKDTLTTEDMRARVDKLTKKSLRLGDALNQSSPDEDFHVVRKRLKKLRYTLGFLLAVEPDKKVAKAEKSLKQIQEYLGEFQDQTVLANELDLKAQELMQLGDEHRQDLLELGISIGETRSQIQNLKSGFPKAYGKFSKSMSKYLLDG